MWNLLILFAAVTTAGAFRHFKNSLPRVYRTYKSATVSADVSSKLKVPSSSWKWPPVWPFPDDFMAIGEETETKPLDSTLSTIFYDNFKQFTEPTDKILCIGLVEDDPISGDSQTEFLKYTNDMLDLPYSPSSFDKVLVLSGVESFKDPQTLYKEIWRILKPKGACMTCFSGECRLERDFKPIKMWTTMTDEQKIWIAGSYFHYSLPSGWEGIEGYDLLGTTGGEKLVFNPAEGEKEKNMSAYGVLARKIATPDLSNCSTIDEFSLFFKPMIQGLRHVGLGDVKFISFRFASKYFAAKTDEEKEKVLNLVPKMSSIYETLKQVQEVVIPSPAKAMLAVSIVEEWTGAEEQVKALRMGLGLDKPDDTFWNPIAKTTNLLTPKDKIYFMADLIPRFGKPEYNALLSRFPCLLSEVLEILRERLTNVEEAQLQLLTANLLISDFLLSDKQNAEEILIKFVKTYSAAKLAMIMKPADTTKD